MMTNAADVTAAAAVGRGSRRVRWPRLPENAALITGSVIVGVAVVASLWSLFQGDAATEQDLVGRLTPPAWAGGDGGHLLGTDSLGRDVFARILEGTRTSLVISLSAVVLGMIAGVLIGLLTGYFRGWVDVAFMRFADAVLAIPTVLLALTVIAIVGGGVRNLVFVIAFAQWMAFARNTRAEALVHREMLYTTAARSIGARHGRIMLRHVLPHTVPSTIVLATLSVSSAILIEAGLSFLGIGVQPPAASLGGMLSEGRQYVSTAPWLAIFPGLAIFVLVLGINVLGDGLRTHLDRAHG
jgi:peptide/nickel transport system permease protein